MISNTKRADLFAKARTIMAKGENVIEGLTQQENASRTTAIEIAYALQAGSYTEYSKTEMAGLTRREGHAILEPLLKEYVCETLLDCGAGEGTRWLDFGAVLDDLTLLDASWARLKFAPAILDQVPSIASYHLVKGNMMALPFAPGSFDAVFTSHAIEPNTNANAEHIVRNLFKMARKLVVLFEPNYRDAHPEMRQRMDRHGYAQNTWDVAEAQTEFSIVAQGTFKFSPNPDNRTSYIALRRNEPLDNTTARMRAPGRDIDLYDTPDGFRSIDGSFAYPRVDGIACLAEEDGVFLGAPSQLPS